MKKSHYLIYGLGVAISLTLIGLYFINPEFSWCIVSCSTGASLIGAVVLGFFIDLSNEMNKAAHNKRVFEIAHVDMFTAMHSLLMVVYHPLKEFYDITENESAFKYDNLTIKSLIQKYIIAINDIKSCLVKGENGQENAKIEVNEDKRQQILSLLDEYKEEILNFRLKFKNLWASARQQENVLLVNDSSFEGDIKKAILALEILSKNENDENGAGCLLSLGDSFNELVTTNTIDILEKIGFDNVRFKNDKGFFNIELNKDK